MKQTILMVAIMAIAGSAFATGPAVGGTAGSVSGSAAFATSSGNGGSWSGASNRTWSSVAYGADSGSSAGFTYSDGCRPSVTGTVAQGSARVYGATEAGSVSDAVNKSWGNGTGGAVAGGLSNANVAGAAGYVNVGVAGGVTGFATSTAGNAVVAGPNTGGSVGSSNTAGFGADASSSQTTKYLPFKQTNVAQTNATAGSVSNAGQFGNATLVNVNGGTAGAGAVAAAGKVTSVD